MTKKKQYSRPEVIKVSLDNSVTLMMKSHPKPPKPRGHGGKGTNDPAYEDPAFKSPFGDKPFS